MIRILDYENVTTEEIFARTEAKTDVSGIVSEIIAEVRARGDAALLEYAMKFDGAELSALQVTAAELEDAKASVDDGFLDILREVADNIRRFHRQQVREGFTIRNEDGTFMGQKVIPMDKVGLYVPGGTAVYPSTVLMDSIPAKIAGCNQVIIVTPPDEAGRIDPAILAAADIAGVDKIFKVGGAQAVAALAYGTETIPQVDKIVGPGNAFVAEAKRQVFGQVAIDMIAGPSEILIVADGTCDAANVAADMLSQAEHDKMASAVLITDDPGLAEAVSAELEKQLSSLEREDIARTSIEENGKIIVTPDLDLAIDVANEIAPEHLELCMDEPLKYLEKVRNAGSVFLGKNCPEALGDYFAGPNHTLPTSGTARFSSPLSVDDFVKKTQFTYYTKEALEKVAGKIDTFARKEGLTGHGRSVTIRFKK